MLVSAVRRQLDALVDDDLIGGFLPSGRAGTEELQSKQKSWQMDARKFWQSRELFEMAGLGKKDLMADYAHWSLSAYFTIDEVLFLSVGLEPNDQFKGSLDVARDRAKKGRNQIPAQTQGDSDQGVQSIQSFVSN